MFNENKLKALKKEYDLGSGYKPTSYNKKVSTLHNLLENEYSSDGGIALDAFHLICLVTAMYLRNIKSKLNQTKWTAEDSNKIRLDTCTLPLYIHTMHIVQLFLGELSLSFSYCLVGLWRDRNILGPTTQDAYMKGIIHSYSLPINEYEMRFLIWLTKNGNLKIP